MVEPGDDFDDASDEPRRPLLPPDDRLWRHPSELSQRPLASDGELLAARGRWLASTPSRAGAGAAGLVGALLATGVVLLGTHLTSWLTPAHPTVRLQSSSTATTLASIPPQIGSLTPMISSIAAALVRVRVVRDSQTEEVDGTFIDPNGYVMTAASAVQGATSVSVIRPDNEELIATVRGTDPETGLAVLKVDNDGDSSYPWLELSPSHSDPVGALTLAAWWWPGARSFAYCIAPLSSSPTTTSMGDGPALLQLWGTSLGLDDDPVGSVVTNGSGQVLGMVTAHTGKAAVVTPGWLLGRISAYLMADGRVMHGWLGIEGTAAPLPPSQPASAGNGTKASPNRAATAVRIVDVMPDSAASKAGLSAGEMIEAVNGQPVSSMADLQAMLYLMPPRTSVRLQVLTSGGQSEVSARLQSVP